MPPFCGKGRFVARVAVPAIASLIVASPLLLHFRALLSQTVDRGTPQLDFAAQNSFSFTEALGGWVFPPVSSMEGWYSFGTICVLLLGYHCVLSIFAIKDYREDRVLACMILVWSATVLYFTLGRDSALFTFVWHHVALLNQMRCWSRMTIILVPPIALLLARALEHFGGVLGGSRAFAGRWFLSVFAIIAAATAALQFYYLRQGHFDYYWVHFFKNYPSYIADVPAVRSRFPFHLVLASDEWRFFRMTLWAAAGLLVLLLWRRWGSPKPLLARAFPAAFVVFSAADLCLVSPFQWSDLAAVQLRGEHFDAYALLKTGFSQPRDLFGEAIVHEDRPTYSVAPFENWDFNRHVRVYLKYLDYSSGQWRAGVSPAEKALVTRFYGADSSAARIFFSSKIDQASPPDFMNDADRFAKQWKPSYRVKAYDGDLLRLEVSMPHPGWLSFVDSWDPYWTASVNRQAVPISLLLGGYKAVFVPEGRAEVQFAYRPSFWPKAARP